MAHISHKLTNSFEGALAGGGDPATSPLYVFGPFLKLIVVAGVAKITFGASIWLVVLTVIAVSAMYRLVMVWVTDGSGGSGLSEEEFGPWAVKVNAAITFIEYTLTFLVSIAAMVTFIADRFPPLNNTFLGFQYRTFVAIILSILIGWLVNRGPKMAARAFGPATAGVLLLLWIMTIATIWQYGLNLPDFNLQAFTPEYLQFTFGGYTRILALMTGIEIFANMVPAYGGTAKEKGRKAFGSLLLIMGTTSITMLVVGPAIFQLSDPTNEHVSVFTQTMDQLLPAPLPFLGTLVGIAVLMSAAAASAQGLQNLALGLKYRHYVPVVIGQRNKFDVADKPAWIEVGIVSLCFLALGTDEETYLAVYAAGVFILLAMTGWAAVKRLSRQLRSEFSWGHFATLAGTILGATLVSGATAIIFWERFFEGAWVFLILIPGLYMLFTYFRNRLGEPTPFEKRLGRKYLSTFPSSSSGKTSQNDEVAFDNILIPLDGSTFAEQPLSLAKTLCHKYDAQATLVSIQPAKPKILPPLGRQGAPMLQGRADREAYLEQIVSQFNRGGLKADFAVGFGHIVEEIGTIAQDNSTDLVIMSTHGRSGLERWLIGSIASKLIRLTQVPILLIRPSDEWRTRDSRFKHLLVTLDGSKTAERVLPYVRTFATIFNSKVLLISVPEGLEPDDGEVEQLEQYLDNVAKSLRELGATVEIMVTGSEPAHAIVDISENEATDLVMMATHGRGGLERLMLGSVADRVIRHTHRPIFLVPPRSR